MKAMINHEGGRFARVGDTQATYLERRGWKHTSKNRVRSLEKIVARLDARPEGYEHKPIPRYRVAHDEVPKAAPKPPRRGVLATLAAMAGAVMGRFRG